MLEVYIISVLFYAVQLFSKRCRQQASSQRLKICALNANALIWHIRLLVGADLGLHHEKQTIIG